MLKLEIELVPRSCFYSNVRSEVSKSEWDKIRKKCYSLANNSCEICGGKGRRHAVEAHEVWEYLEGTPNIQRLKRMIALCPSCHEVKHIGLAQLRGNLERAIAHFCKVNSVGEEFAVHYIKLIDLEWQRRSSMNWELDITHLDEFIK